MFIKFRQAPLKLDVALAAEGGDVGLLEALDRRGVHLVVHDLPRDTGSGDALTECDTRVALLADHAKRASEERTK